MFTNLQTATLEEIRHAAARICRDYLKGRWQIVSPEQLIVKRISGGLSNFLYYVSLPELEDDEVDIDQQLLSGNNAHIKSVIALTGAFDAKNSNNNNNFNDNNILCHEQRHKIYGNEEHFETTLAMARELAHSHADDEENDDEEDSGLAVKRSYKRQRFDSDSGDSGSLKRLHAQKQEPREVLLRIYGQTHGDHALENMITESVVFALLSERNFGPKLHGIFPGGRIEQYIPARALLTNELSDPRISMKIAEKMGDIHSLNIPMSKEPDWIWNCMDRWLKGLHRIVKGKLESKPNSTVLQKQRELMSTIDYVKEIAWLHSVIDAGDYPVVFCHNDLQEGNILMLKNEGQERRISIGSLRSHFDETLGDSLDGSTNKSHSDSSTILLDTTEDSALDASFMSDHELDLRIIDFEYCAYNYRAFDLANHFIEWTIDYTNPQFPYFHHHKELYPTSQQRSDFIVQYLKKFNEDEHYEPTQQELQKVEDEVQLFNMFSHLFWSLWAVVNVTSAIEFGYWEYGIARILEYQDLKAAYLAKSK